MIPATYVHVGLSGDLCWFVVQWDINPMAFKEQMRSFGTPVVAIIRPKTVEPGPRAEDLELRQRR